MKAYQVLTEGNYFGKIYFVGENSGTNVLDFDDIISLKELNALVTRIIPVEQVTGHHCNINVLNPDTLIKLHTILVKQKAGAELDATEQKLFDDNSQLTIRVSGFAVRFFALTEEQRKDVITRTFTTKF